MKCYRSDNEERIHEGSDFASADHHPHGRSLWAASSQQKPQCHSQKLANASETPQENENSSSGHLHETVEGCSWASSPCQSLTHPFPRLWSRSHTWVAAIHSKHPLRRPDKDAEPCPAPSLPACFRASHTVSAPTPLKARAPSMATHLILQSLPRAHPCQRHLGYLLRLGSPSPSQHKLQPLLPKLLSIPLHN